MDEMNTQENTNLASARRYRQERIAHWDVVARSFDRWKGLGGYYHRRLQQVYRTIIPAGARVLELGCGTGDLLASLCPSHGVGVDFSQEMVTRARLRHPELTFIRCDAADLEMEEKFDFIILSDILNDLWDVQAVLEKIHPLTTPRTRIILNSYSRLWELPLRAAQALRLARPTLYQNWLTVDDISNLLYLSGYERIRHWPEVLLPFGIPLLSGFINKFLVRLWPFHFFALTHFLIARPAPKPETARQAPLVSVIVPARNEAGNIAAIFERTPEMGAGTELVFVEGNSRDNTVQAIQEAMAQHPERRCQFYQQTGVGKGDAVRLGFEKASGDILMILDADLTVPPEDLPRFVEALASGKAEFVNGVRLVYPMEQEAMRFFNLIGNKFFSLAFSWLLGQPVKDTLCGTKVLWKEDYQSIVTNRAYFGDFDPFGDFDLLFGASRLSLKIIDLPVRYRERTYGTTNISRWKHGWLLLRMVAFAATRIKFI